jgi:SHS2 domain-containing protein
MKRFELIEHTLAEAFANAAYGLFAIIAELKNVRESEYRQVEIREEDSETLLFEWLNHLLYLFDVETILFRRFDISGFDGLGLRATCYGERYDPSRHQLQLGVKSATYHMLEVDRERNQVQVIFDV